MMRRAHHQFVATVLLSTVSTGVALAGGAALAAEPATSAQARPAAAPPPFPKALTLKGVAFAKTATASFAPTTVNPLRGYPTGPIPRSWEKALAPNGEALTAGIYNATTETGQNIQLYCVDATTATAPGVHYRISPTKTATTPNLGYIGTILMNNYPNTSAPTSLAAAADKAKAVQLAIWFFSNRLVADPADPHYAAAAAIVTDALRRGPLVNAGVPKLYLTGPSTAVLNRVSGPIHITGGTGDVTVSISNGQLYADAAGKLPIANGTSVSATMPLYVKLSKIGKADISVKGGAVVPAGSEVVYEPSAPAVGTVSAQIALYQTMVLASQTQLLGQGAMPVNGVAAPTKTTAKVTRPSGGSGGTGVSSGLAVTPAAPNAPIGALLAASGLMIGLGVLAVATTRRRRTS
jgi:TQXA domain-containing protein